jgi:hypothetical protein
LCFLHPFNLPYHQETTFLPNLYLVNLQYFLYLLHLIFLPCLNLQHFNYFGWCLDLWHFL